MTFVIILLIILLVICVLYLLAIRPNTERRSRLRAFQETYIAHRGLFDNKTVPENSMPAFRKAIEAGYGIELDVQLTTDNRLVVFHDDSLERVCNDPRKIFEISYEESQKLRLLDTDEKIPLFEDVLKLINGQVPLVMELKPEGRYLETAERASKMLKDYDGKVCLESFHPMILNWFRKNDRRIPRGLLASDFFKEDDNHPVYIKFILTNLLLNFLARPDFISFNQHFKNQFSYRVCKALYHPVNAAWTIRSQSELEEAKKDFSIFIFDSFIPDEGK